MHNLVFGHFFKSCYNLPYKLNCLALLNLFFLFYEGSEVALIAKLSDYVGVVIALVDVVEFQDAFGFDFGKSLHLVVEERVVDTARLDVLHVDDFDGNRTLVEVVPTFVNL